MFDRNLAPPTLSISTIAVLEEIASVGHREWIAGLLFSVLDGRRSVAALRETLSHERLPRDLVDRIMHTMQDVHP